MRQLSSRSTLFKRFVAPLLWVGVMGWAAFTLVFHGVVAFYPARPHGMLVWRDDAIVTDLRRLARLDAAVPDQTTLIELGGRGGVH